MKRSTVYLVLMRRLTLVCFIMLHCEEEHRLFSTHEEADSRMFHHVAL